METKKDYSKLEAPERIKAVKETFGEFEDFLVKASPNCQISFSDFEKALLGNYPTLKDICLTYGNDATAKWLLPQVVDLGEFADANNMTKSQFIELASVIARECQDLKISEVLNFFYQMKSAQLPITDKLSPLSVIVNLRNFLYKRQDIPTEDEYNKLLKAADNNQNILSNKLLAMNDRKDVPKNYRSIYRTCLNWLNRDKK